MSESQPAASPHPTFTDWSQWSDLRDLVPAVEALLQEADWNNFLPERDLLPLRKVLSAIEEAQGIREVHRQVSDKLLPVHGRLLHRYGHQGPIVAQAMSPNRQWLATGSWVHDDYDEGGELMIWEVATGRCVNIITGVEGGIGWPDYPDCIQWRADSGQLGIAFNTNGIGTFAPFVQERMPQVEAYVTDGWSRPPAWCWAPDGQRIMVAAWGQGSPIPGCTFPLDKSRIFEDDVSWFAPEIGPDILPEEDTDLQPFKKVHWSRDGKLIYGHNSHGQAFGIEAETGALRYVTKFGAPLAWDPDDQNFAHNLAGLLFYETQTGLPTFRLPMILGAGAFHWSKVQGQQRLAVLVYPGNQFGADACVHVYEQGELLCTVEGLALRISYDELADRASWAWSPGGQQAALLMDHGLVQVWSIEKQPELLVELKVSEAATGIAWGAESTLVVTGPSVVEFWELTTASCRSRYDLDLPDGLSHPPIDEAPLADLDELFPYDYFLSPCAPVLHEAEFAWITAYEDGKVIAAPEIHDRLPTELCFAIAGKYAWPWSWTRPQLKDNLAQATHAWDLGFQVEAEVAPEAPALPSVFRLCSVHQPDKTWASNFTDIRKHAQVSEYELPLKPKKSYKAEEMYKTEKITEAVLRPLLGKCVIYAETSFPKSVEIGALMAIKDGSAFIIFHDQSFCSTGWHDLGRLAYIGAAVPRAQRKRS